MHHTYPSVNRNEVKKLLDGYIHRFYVHGAFKVSDGLDAEVKTFLSNDILFKKNPQSDIQWALLSLLTSLAADLTQVVQLPKMMPLNEDETPVEEINWGEYLKEGLPKYEHVDTDDDSDSSDMSFVSQGSDTFMDYNEENKVDENENENENTCKEKETSTVEAVPQLKNLTLSRQHIIDDLVRRREEETSFAKDIMLRGNFVQELGLILNTSSPSGSQQMLSEFEMVGYVLKQFLTGENILKRKGITNPSTCSLTNVTLKSYLASIQPYINMMKVFKEFNSEVMYFENGKNEQFFSSKGSNCSGYSLIHFEGNINKMKLPYNKTVPNIIKLYNSALNEALSSFENKILTMSEYQQSYTLLKVLFEIRPSFSDLSSLFAVHLAATADWLNVPNWLCSVRIITTLYKAILNSTCNRMGFLYMNMFLYCFQAYLDITDRWISCLTLNDPHEEYLIYKCEEQNDLGTSPYKIRPFKEKLHGIGTRELKILEYLSDKLIYVGHSIDVLHRLDRSLIKDQNESNIGLARDCLYRQLLKNIKEEFRILHGTKSASVDCKEISNICVTTKNSESEITTLQTESSTNGYKSNIICNNGVKDSSDNDIVKKDMALSEFCRKMCEQDQMGVIEKSIWPLGIIIESNLKSILNARVLNTCNLAKNVVVNEFQLKTHLRLLRNIFLFNEPHLIQPFIFMMSQEETIWKNGYALTVHLRECIESRYSDQARFLSVSVDWSNVDQTNSSNGILDAIDGMTISYQIDWPLRLVFTPYIMSLYNNVFKHLFKLHLAHQALCKLHYRATDRKKPDIVKSSRQRLELLRFWCMSTLGRLRSYFMAQISTPFDLQINNYQHLSQILEAHESFIKKIHSRCLLDDNAGEGKDLIFDVFVPLCFDLYQFGTSYEVIPDSILTPTESIFSTFQRKFPPLMAQLEKD
ncbi:UNVERIFIED_CONTAM: hypothetical protein PYX00_002929 [Menopon gallinae]